MTSTDLLKWIENHLVTLRMTVEEDFEMVWIDEKGYSKLEFEPTLKACIRKAATKCNCTDCKDIKY